MNTAKPITDTKRNKILRRAVGGETRQSQRTGTVSYAPPTPTGLDRIGLSQHPSDAQLHILRREQTR